VENKKTIIDKIYLLLLIVNIFILPIILIGSGFKQYSYFTGDYKEKIIRIEKCSNTSSSKRKSVSVEGRTNNKQQVYFALFDDEEYDFFSYLNPLQEENLQKIDHNNLKPLKLDVRVIQFSDFKNVLYLKKSETAEEDIKKDLQPWIVTEIILIGLLIVFYFLRKRQ
jgi:hypothetical protein